MQPLEYQGQYAACKVFTDNVDGMVVQQIYGFLNSPAFEGATIRIMPDVHAGFQ
jgi:tRNA-splicing ligase RtcB